METNSLTGAFLASLVPNGGLVLITSPLGTLLEAWFTATGCRLALTISFSAACLLRPTTFGTAMLLPFPETYENAYTRPAMRATAAMAATIHGHFLRPWGSSSSSSPSGPYR